MTQAFGPTKRIYVLPFAGPATVPWRYLAAAEHEADFLTTNGSVLSTISHGSGFTISPNAAQENTGVLTLIAAPPPGATKLRLRRRTTPVQNYVATPGAEAVERQLDRDTLLLQEVSADLDGLSDIEEQAAAAAEAASAAALQAAAAAHSMIDKSSYKLRETEPVHAQFKFYHNGNWFSPKWRVVTVAGQSNGRGNDYATDGDKTGEGEVWTWNGTEIVEATLGELPFNDAGSVNNAAFHTAHRISVEQQCPVFLIVHAIPGTAIGTWLPPYANNSNTPGTNWTGLNTKIDAAFAGCAAELWGQDTVDVMLWQQGEGEYALGPLYSLSTDRYPALLTGFFEADWAAPDMQVIVGQCLPQSAGGTAWQTNEEWAKMLNWPRVHIAVGTGLVTTGHDSGQIVHYSGASLQELGYRMADIYNGVSTGLTSDALYKAADTVGGTFWKERLYSRLIDLTFSASDGHPQTITVPTPQAGVPVVFEVDGVRSEVISGGSAATYTLESADPAHVIIWYPSDAMVDQKPGVSVVASTYTGRLRSFQMHKIAQLASLYLSSQPELQHSVRPADWPRSLTTFRINASPLIRFDDFVAADMPIALTILTFTSTTPVPVWVREAVEYENTKRDGSITTVTFGTNYGPTGELPPPSDAPMPISALLSNAAIAGRTYVPLTQILGRGYNAATDDFAVLLAAVMDDIFDAGLTIVDDVGLALRWVTPIICGSTFDVDFGKAKITKVLSNTGVGNAAIRNTDIDVPMDKFRWIGGTIRELNSAITGTLMRINAEEVELSDLDAEFHGGIGVSLNSTDTGSIINTHNKIVSTETAEGSGDACVRIGGGSNIESHSNVFVSDEDAHPITTNTSPSGALPNRNTNNAIITGNVIKTNGRLVGAVGASSNPAAANSTHTGLHSNLTFENIRGTCGQLFRLCFDDVAAGLRADNITLRDIKGQFQSWTRSIAAEIVGQNSGSIGRVMLDDIVCPDPLRPFGLVLDAPGATINGDKLKFTGGRNALRILRAEAGIITLNNCEFIATNTNLVLSDDDVDDNDIGVTDRRDPVRIENATRNARTFISMNAVGTDGQQIVIGSTTYTLKNTVGAAYSVKIGATKEDTAANLTAAINAGAGSGTLYGAGTSAHPSVTATIPKPTKLYRVAILAIATGAAGNGIAVTLPASASYKNATTVGGFTPTGRLQVHLKGKTVIRGVYSPTISGTPTPMSGINCTADNVDFIIEHLKVYKTTGATNTWAITAATGCTVRIKSLSGDVDNLGVTGGATLLPWFDERVAVRAPSGSAAVPSISFQSNQDTGLLNPSSNQIGFATSGVQRLLLTTAVLTSTVPLRTAAGTVGAPSRSWTSDTDTGWYQEAVDTESLALGGVKRAQFTATGLLVGPSGTAPVVQSYATRAAAVTAIAAGAPAVGSLIMFPELAGSDILAVRYTGSGTVISDMPGWVPAASGARVPIFGQLTADYALTSTTALQKLFNLGASGAITLETGLYELDLLAVLTSMDATTGNAGFSLLGAGTAALSQVFQHAVGADQGNPQNGTPTTQTGAFANTEAFAGMVAVGGTSPGLGSEVHGMFRVTTAGTIIPSVALTTAIAAQVESGSYIRITRLADSGVNSTPGAWS